MPTRHRRPRCRSYSPAASSTGSLSAPICRTRGSACGCRLRCVVRQLHTSMAVRSSAPSQASCWAARWLRSARRTSRLRRCGGPCERPASLGRAARRHRTSLHHPRPRLSGPPWGRLGRSETRTDEILLIFQAPTENQWFWLPRALQEGLLELSWAVLGASWVVLGLSWALLGPPWTVSKPSWAVLGPSWKPFGPPWGDLG